MTDLRIRHFPWKQFSEKDIEKVKSKASEDSDIPTKYQTFLWYSLKELSKSLEICRFRSCLKMANVTTVYKRGNRSDKDNYHPVSILPKLWKNFDERCLCKQISAFLEDILSKYQCGFRKEHSMQHYLLALIEKWKQSLDYGKTFGSLLIDLLKTVHCLRHSLIIVKLNTYSFDNNPLKLVNDY